MDVQQPQSLMEVTSPPPVKYETTLHYSKDTWLDTIAKVATFVSEIYAQFPGMSEEKAEEFRKAGGWLNKDREPASAPECEKFQEALKTWVFSALQKEHLVKISTDYYPEDKLEKIATPIFRKQPQLGFLFPYKTCTWIYVNKEKQTLSLDMNFKGPRF